MRIVVTGAGSGLGRATARRLLAHGHAVLATDLDPARLDGLADGTPGALQVQALDLGIPATITALVEAAGDVDALVANAGYGYFSAVGEADFDAVDRLFRDNVVGTARLAAGLLPSLRARRGTVVLVSSISGRIVFPESGFYAATKHALEAWAAALWQENQDAGLRVAIVRPGAFDTSFHARAMGIGTPTEAGPWADQRPAWDCRREAVLEAPQDPERVAEVIAAALGAPEAFSRWPVGDDAVRMLAGVEALGEDGWLRAYADGQGAPGGLPDPADVVEDGLDGPTLAQLHAAFRAGLLEHWTSSASGRAALAHLAARAAG